MVGLRFLLVCGPKGYTFHTGVVMLPLPSSRLVKQRLQPLDFRPGLLDDYIRLLKWKIETLEPFGR